MKLMNRKKSDRLLHKEDWKLGPGPINSFTETETILVLVLILLVIVLLFWVPLSELFR